MKVARFLEDIKEGKLRFSYLAILFVLISFLGWCGETVYFVLRWDDFTDRGFLSLPLCTIYGCSILAIYLIIGTPTRGRLKPLFIRAKKLTPVLRVPAYAGLYILYFIAAALIPTVAEFVTALDDASTYFTTSSLAADWELFDETSGTLSADNDVSSAQTYTVIDYYHVLCSELRTAVGPNVWYFNPSTLNPFIRAAKEIDDYHFEVKVVAEAGGQSYETVSRMKFNASSLNIAVTNVSVSSDIVF